MARRTKAHRRQGYTAADKRAIKLHLNKLCQLGCIACWSQGQKTNAGIHHIRQGLGLSQRSSDLRT
jgi:hypothetical protein